MASKDKGKDGATRSWCGNCNGTSPTNVNRSCGWCGRRKP
jgi:hypothetical protein